MRGFDLHHYLGGAVFLGTASIKGSLVLAGHYPGLIAGEQNVRGEVYRLAEPENDLETLDDVEDFDPIEPERSMYVRRSATVTLDSGEQLEAWVYFYNQPVAGLPVIEGGDWRATSARR